MNALTSRTVGEIAAEVPAAIRIFEKFRIDYCCGGATPLTDACTAAGVTVDQFLGELDRSAAMPDAGIDWTKTTLSELHSYIVATYHMHGREELETLGLLANKVLSVHGERHHELQTVARLVAALQQDMLPHMVKEEMVLFPYVASLEDGTCDSGSCFGSVENPIRVMLYEHEAVGDLLAELRRVTAGYSVPDDGCFSYRELYNRLSGFERETHQHIHLENNIYFPRAIELQNRTPIAPLAGAH